VHGTVAVKSDESDVIYYNIYIDYDTQCYHYRLLCDKQRFIYAISWRVIVFDLLVFCFTEVPNTNVAGGRQVSSANSVSACKVACGDEAQCNGFDFVPSESEGRRCWLSGSSWSGARGQSDISTHYDIDRDCGDGNVCWCTCSRFPGVTSIPELSVGWVDPRVGSGR